MNSKIPGLFIAIALMASAVHAQTVSFKDSLAAYTQHKLKINRTGLKVLGAWGLTNVAAGGIGYLSAGNNNEMKYFSEMNLIWGAVNTGIAAYGLHRLKVERKKNLNFEQSYQSYLKNKRLFLLNAGLDVLYIGAGVGLAAYAQNAGNDKAMYSGYGKSVVIQGVVLLLFDNAMYSAHQLDNSKWFRLMNEVRFLGNGIGYVHTF